LLTGQKEFIAGFLLLFLAGPRLLPIRWYLLIPAFWGLSLYALVHVEARLVGVFFVFFWLALFSCLRVRSQRLVTVAALMIVFATAFKTVKAEVSGSHNSRNVQWVAATQLGQLGLHPGDRVAVLGHTTIADDWAHLGGLRIVADVPLEEMPSYWSATPEKRSEISSALAAWESKPL
jgi:hypothetical protein